MTCSLASTSEKRGAHRCFIAAQTDVGSGLWTLRLDKGRRTRREEDEIASSALIKATAAVYNASDGARIDDGIALPLTPSESFEGGFRAHDVDAIIRMMITGDRDADCMFLDAVEIRPRESATMLTAENDAVVVDGGGVGVMLGFGTARTVLPGSFNPLHVGHVKLLSAASELQDPRDVHEEQEGVENELRRSAGGGAFELSVSNADKGSLEFTEVKARVQQFIDKGETILLTRSPLYVDKVTIDTALRGGGNCHQEQHWAHTLTRLRHCIPLVSSVHLDR